jgi:hypothetical protein
MEEGGRERGRTGGGGRERRRTGGGREDRGGKMGVEVRGGNSSFHLLLS